MAALSAVVFGAFGMGASAANAATTYGPQKTLATNIQAAAVGVDSVGNVFVSETSIGNYYGDYTAQQIFEIPATGTNEYAKLWEGAQDLPAGEIAVDRSGNLYYADSVGLIQKVSPLQEVPTGADPYSPPVTVTIGNDPDFAAGGVAIDSAGNLFASDLNQGGAIWEVPASGPSKLIDGSAGAQSLAVDKAGDLFWTQANNGNQIWELPAGASPSQAARLASGYTFAAPQGVAVNSSGDVFVANSGAGNVVDLPASSGNPGTGTPSTLGNGFIQPVDIAVDSAGDVFVADLGNIGTGNGQVAEIPAIQTAPTTTTVTSSANPIYLGQPVTFTVNVKETSGSATPTGTVALVMGETTVGTATLDPTGTATITTSSLPPGYDEITAVYAGDSSNASSNSQMFPETVNAPTVASLISLTGQYVEGSAAFKKLPARSQAATIKLIDAATQYLTQYNPKLTAKQKAALVSGYDLAITVLQRSGYLTSDQVTTLKTIAANL